MVNGESTALTCHFVKFQVDTFTMDGGKLNFCGVEKKGKYGPCAAEKAMGGQNSCS
jgi:hypothetical protein